MYAIFYLLEGDYRAPGFRVEICPLQTPRPHARLTRNAQERLEPEQEFEDLGFTVVLGV